MLGTQVLVRYNLAISLEHKPDTVLDDPDTKKTLDQNIVRPSIDGASRHMVQHDQAQMRIETDCNITTVELEVLVKHELDVDEFVDDFTSRLQTMVSKDVYVKEVLAIKVELT